MVLPPDILTLSPHGILQCQIAIKLVHTSQASRVSYAYTQAKPNLIHNLYFRRLCLNAESKVRYQP